MLAGIEAAPGYLIEGSCNLYIAGDEAASGYP